MLTIPWLLSGTRTNWCWLTGRPQRRRRTGLRTCTTIPFRFCFDFLQIPWTKPFPQLAAYLGAINRDPRLITFILMCAVPSEHFNVVSGGPRWGLNKVLCVVPTWKWPRFLVTSVYSQVFWFGQPDFSGSVRGVQFWPTCGHPCLWLGSDGCLLGYLVGEAWAVSCRKQLEISWKPDFCLHLNHFK